MVASARARLSSRHSSAQSVYARERSLAEPAMIPTATRGHPTKLRSNIKMIQTACASVAIRNWRTKLLLLHIRIIPSSPWPAAASPATCLALWTACSSAPARTSIDDVPNAENTIRFGQDDSLNACMLCHADKAAEWVQSQLKTWKSGTLRRGSSQARYRVAVANSLRDGVLGLRHCLSRNLPNVAQRQENRRYRQTREPDSQ